LLDRPRIGEERAEVVVVRLQHFVAETVRDLEPLPPGELAVLRDQRHRRLRERLEVLVALAGVRDQRLRILLEYRGDGHGRHAIPDVVEAVQQIARHQEIDAASRQQRPVVHLRPALQDRHVEPGLAIRAIRHGLIEPAMRRPAPSSWSRT
jgi:hypothetical protein